MFNREQLAAGNESWERPAIQSLDAWLVNCWQELRFRQQNPPSLLSPLQERELWRQIIASDRPHLFDHRAMAHLSQQAARILAEYKIPTEGDAWEQDPDAQGFLRWHKQLQQQLQKNRWITRADLFRLIEQTEAVFATPISNQSPAIAQGLAFESPKAELVQVAASVRKLLERGETSIGVLVADLSRHSSELLRLLPAGYVHIQNGTWLDNPLIANALLFLELARPRMNHASVGAILRSPFMDGAREERGVRAMAFAKLQRSRELDFSQPEIEKAIWDHCSILYQVLRRTSKVTQKFDSQMRLSAWSAGFSDILQAAKWPAIDHLTETEQNAVDQWSKALSELASLGLVSPKVTLDEALDHLRTILNRPQETGNWSSPVQVLDAATADGIEFDHSFVVNVNEESWPTVGLVSPLIPYRLQRQYQVPESHPDQAAAERWRKTAALLTSSPDVRVSFSGTLAPILRKHVETVASEKISESEFVAIDLHVIEDNQAPRLQSSEVSGGANVLKSQSACPFKAFAEFRLGARGEDEASVGFDALERGESAHRALEYIWTELHDQQTLKQMPADNLRALVVTQIQRAVQEEADAGPIREITSAAERERLTNLLLQWLELEKQRSVFTVEKLEEKRDVEFGGLKLSLRMDRIDRLPNGNLVLIDYKSGKQSSDNLAGERPKEPQLLIYAAAAGEPIDGLYFGELRNRHARPVGHAVQKHFPKQQRAIEEHGLSWNEFVGHAREVVHHLAGEFVQGEASVCPQPDACKFCDMNPICRVGDGTAPEEEEA